MHYWKLITNLVLFKIGIVLVDASILIVKKDRGAVCLTVCSVLSLLFTPEQFLNLFYGSHKTLF